METLSLQGMLEQHESCAAELSYINIPIPVPTGKLLKKKKEKVLPHVQQTSLILDGSFSLIYN